jgi:curved DNA-binding protein CbpA
MPSRSDPYAVLGVARTATQRQIREAFRRLARDHHPDANPDDPGAERRFKRIARAYELVKTAAARKAYDARLRSGRFAGPGAAGAVSFVVDRGPIYHSDLGHHSDFYQAGDPLTISEAAALVGRDAAWLRRAVRERRLAASRGERGYLVRRRDVERLDRTAPRRRARDAGIDANDAEGASEGTA